MITINNDRQCGQCTMCCQGHLTGNAHGFDFGPGKPCHFIRDSGCAIYPFRPYSPCKTFKCEWKTSKNIPESLRPDKSKVIFVLRETENGERLDVIESGEPLSADILHLIITLFNNHKYDYIHYKHKGEWYDLKR